MNDATGQTGRPGDLTEVFAAIDSANAQDPNRTDDGGAPRPAELVYGERMSAALGELYPDASDELRIAARAQHIRRWIVPRADYPMDRKGYLRWRNALKRRHAEIASQIMAGCGFAPESIERVAKLIRKQGLKRDPEVQALEDVACVVFLKHYFAAFAKKHDNDRLVSILRKTWAKMSPRGHAAALAIDLPPGVAGLMRKALGEGNGV